MATKAKSMGEVTALEKQIAKFDKMDKDLKGHVAAEKKIKALKKRLDQKIIALERTKKALSGLRSKKSSAKKRKR